MAVKRRLSVESQDETSSSLQEAFRGTLMYLKSGKLLAEVVQIG